MADLSRRLPFGRFQGNKTGLEEASGTGALLVSNSMCLVHANGLMGGVEPAVTSTTSCGGWKEAVRQLGQILVFSRATRVLLLTGLLGGKGAV